MNVLVLNGSNRLSGTVASLLKGVAEPMSEGNDIEWVDACKLDMKFCTSCMVCRESGDCILPRDDAHTMAERIRDADVLVIGTPTHWGNMCAPLKLLFDRTVPVFMGESPRGMPVPMQKGKRAAIVTACTTPWPFNWLLPESRGAIRAVREVLHYGGYRVVGTLTMPGTKNSKGIPPALMARANRLGNKLAQS